MWPVSPNEYTMSWKDGGFRRIGEFDVPVPDQPRSDKLILGSDLAKVDQKFSRTQIPPDLKTVSQKAREEVVFREYHRRKHGVWIIVNGEPMYLTGLNYYFLNYWWCEFGGLADFRVKDIDWFQFWMMCLMDPQCFGMLDIKPRRVGDTEKALCDGYEHTTRVKNSWFGIQNLSDEDALDDFNRVVDAHNKMTWFFRPINQGTDQPKKGLIFKHPRKKVTRKSVKEDFGLLSKESELVASLNSKITYQPTKLKKFDGKRLSRYRMGEFGKVNPTQMDIIEQWSIIKRCLSLNNGRRIIGKSIWESTSEDYDEGSSRGSTGRADAMRMLDKTDKMWRNSDPTKRDANGRTQTGLYRLFRDAVSCTTDVDEYGFPKQEETKEFLDAHFQSYIDAGDWAGLASEKRKSPLNIEDALTPTASEAVFNSVRIKRRLSQIDHDFDYRNEPIDYLGRTVNYDNIIVRGNLLWDGGQQDSRVIWVPDPEGRWVMTQGAENDNAHTTSGGHRIPGNRHKYCIGIDPVDHAKPEAGGSDAAITVFRRYDVAVDGDHTDEDGNPIVGRWRTNQFVMSYCYRPEEAEEFYEDALKTAVYYGTDVFYETQKIGIRNHFKRRGYWYYLMFRPDELKTAHSRHKKEPGAASGDMIIGQYIEALQSYIGNYIDIVNHPELLKDWMMFSHKNRGKRDLTVASGFTLLANLRTYRDPGEEDDDDVQWFRRYDVNSGQLVRWGG